MFYLDAGPITVVEEYCPHCYDIRVLGAFSSTIDAVAFRDLRRWAINQTRARCRECGKELKGSEVNYHVAHGIDEIGQISEES